MTIAVELLFASGEKVKASVSHDLLDEEGFETVEDYVTEKLTTPPAPHWATIGDVSLFTQSLSGWWVL